jgi:hypothetical protein
MAGKRRFSGPLRPGTKSVRTRVAKKPRGGLNKTEKKQTKAIVKNAIKKDNALKYFDVDVSNAAVVPAVSITADKKEVSVIAFSSTSDMGPGAVQAEKYGPQDFVPLYMTRTFKDSNPVEALQRQAPNGQFVLPKRATCTFSIERVAYNVAHAQGGTPQPTPNMARSLPISYRILKIGFKNTTGTQVVPDINTELFIDSRGQPVGINSNNFDRLDCRMAPINTKLFVKLMDMRGTINQNNIITPADFAGQLTDIVQQKNGSSNKHINCSFMLSNRKNGKLFYEDPNDVGKVSFDSGGRRELILMHYWYDNAHNLTGGDGQPLAPTGADIQIKFKPTAAFVDCQ